MFLRRSFILFFAFGLHFFASAEVKDLPREGFDFFEKNIRPVLVDKCYKCHSASSEKLKGALLLDSKAGILKGGSTGAAIVPFKPDESLLLKAIRYKDEDLQMPPKQKLSDDDIKNFEIWIKLGAPDPRKEKIDEKSYSNWNLEESKKEFWSFQPIRNPPLPPVKLPKWPKNSIDTFILSKLEEKNLAPVPPADKRTLIRRATYDLTGLPPTPEEIKAFLDDKSPDAFEKVVEYLLASPAYGEHWGRHWLDIARYADTSGCNSDFPIPQAFKYRNYVINSFNADKPFDEFIREQIAGDLLPTKNDDEKFQKIIATGYLALARRFGSRNNEFHLTFDDMISTIGQGILGLSTGCARCHDHKFDPIPQKDYYALYGILSSSKYAFPGTEVYRHPKDLVPLASGTNTQAVLDYQAELGQLDEELDKLGDDKRALEARIEEIEDQEEKASAEEKIKLAEDKKEFREKLNAMKAASEDARLKLKKLEYNPPETEKAFAVSEGKPENAKVQKKGSPFNLGDEVPRGFLQILGGQTLPPEEKGSGRLELAQWLTDTNNPLTARVIANRIWQWHFGKGIVQSPNDFGSRGKAPTHPELLDYLATQFIESGWSFKAMHRQIMLSRTYQLSNADDAKNISIDQENNFLWRFNRQRLSAEEIRDSMLAVSGLLEKDMPGAHPFPPENEWKFSQHKPFYALYDTNHRTVYLMQQRIKKHPFLEVWDGADPTACTGERPLTTTPIQALFFMNSEMAYELADKFAVRVGMANTEDAKRLDYAFQLVYGRPARKDEISQGLTFLRECKPELKKSKLPNDQNSRAALASFVRVLFSSNEFLFVN